VKHLAAEITDIQDFAFGRIPVFVEHNSPEAMVLVGARRPSTWSGEERDAGVEVADELRLIAERQWFGGGACCSEPRVRCLGGYIVPKLGIP